jgi:hypothetical protein
MLAGALALAALAPAPAAAVTGPPNIHKPELYSAPPDFGGLLNVSIGNSDENTGVYACVSNHCAFLFPTSLGPIPVNDNAYTATGRDFGLVFKHGQRRTVVIFAANGDSSAQWGPTVLTVD